MLKLGELMVPNHRIRYYVAAVIIATLILLVFIYININTNDSEMIQQSITPGIKGYCLLETNSLECKFFVNNTYNDDILYLNQLTLRYENTTINVTVGLKGISISPNSQSDLIVHLIHDEAVFFLESYNKEMTLIKQVNTSIYDLIIQLEERKLIENEYNLTIYHIILPGEGVILPLDYTMNISNTSKAALIRVTSNSSKIYLDVKEFAWNDILYYEITKHVNMNDYVIVPVPGSNHGYIISRIVVNIINDDLKTVNMTVTGYILNVPSLEVEFHFIGSKETVKVPVICYDCLIKTIQEG